MSKEETPTKDLSYYKSNAEEDYISTPISVLRYISELENNAQHREKKVVQEALEVLEDWHNSDLTELKEIVRIEKKVENFLRKHE